MATQSLDVQKTAGATDFERYHYADWLRILGILAVFLFHNSMFFNLEFWHVKNSVLDQGMTTFADILDVWIMPFMFVISGAATYWALGPRGPRYFLRARLLRLAVPLVFGIFVLTPHQVYLERLTRGQFSGSLLGFLPHYFDGWYGFGGNFGWMGLHLWYLLLLFLFSVVALPLLLYLKGDGGRRLTNLLAAFLALPTALLLLAVPTILSEELLDPTGIGRHDFGGWNVLTYLLLFLYGYLVFSDARLQQAVRRSTYAFLAVTVAGVVFALVASPLAQNTDSFGRAFWNGFRAFESWCGVLAFVGLGMRHLNFSNRQLDYLNEAVLPFYMLHQPVILAVGFFIAGWQLAVLPKYLLLATTSFVVIVAIYELLVRRSNVLRFLFGMKAAVRSSRVGES